MTVTEESPTAFQKLRRDCYDALACSFVSDEDISPILDDIFDIVSKALRRHFGIGFHDTDLILADARNEAERLIGRYQLDESMRPSTPSRNTSPKTKRNDARRHHRWFIKPGQCTRKTSTHLP
jgi:hypothetical protein